MKDIKSVDLNLLKAFDALMTERSVTRAAARLALTQPAVSGMMVRLRDSFDDPLFVRAQRGIVPTARAEELAAPIRRLLDEIAELLQPRVFDPKSACFPLTIAATDYALRAIVVPYIAKVRALAPGAQFTIRTVDGSDVQQQLERGDIDLAIMTPDAAAPNLHARRLFEEHYVCAMRRDHPAVGGPLTLDGFCALDHALVSLSGRPHWGITDDALASIGRKRRVSLSVGSFLLLLEVLRTSDLVAVVPSRLVTGATDLVIAEPPIPIPGFTKIAVWHDRTHNDIALRWARALLFESAADGA